MANESNSAALELKHRLVKIVKEKEQWLPNVGTLALQTLRLVNHMIDNDVTVQECRDDLRPLTYEELLQMNGEPVYVTVPGKPHRSRWCVVDTVSPQPGLHGIEYFCHLSICGTNAVKVYRNKPKEERKCPKK